LFLAALDLILKLPYELAPRRDRCGVGWGRLNHLGCINQISVPFSEPRVKQIDAGA
jgi:hypothetical protein